MPKKHQKNYEQLVTFLDSSTENLTIFNHGSLKKVVFSVAKVNKDEKLKGVGYVVECKDYVWKSTFNIHVVIHQNIYLFCIDNILSCFFNFSIS